NLFEYRMKSTKIITGRDSGEFYRCLQESFFHGSSILAKVTIISSVVIFIRIVILAGGLEISSLHFTYADRLTFDEILIVQQFKLITRLKMMEIDRPG